MEKHQLEMRFDRSVAARPPRRPQRRLTRAHWWFGQMRQAVDRAWDWQPTRAKSRQTCLPLQALHGR